MNVSLLLSSYFSFTYTRPWHSHIQFISNGPMFNPLLCLRFSIPSHSSIYTYVVCTHSISFVFVLTRSCVPDRERCMLSTASVSCCLCRCPRVSCHIYLTFLLTVWFSSPTQTHRWAVDSFARACVCICLNTLNSVAIEPMIVVEMIESLNIGFEPNNRATSCDSHILHIVSIVHRTAKHTDRQNEHAVTICYSKTRTFHSHLSFDSHI